jgi:hypothetical protein
MRNLASAVTKKILELIIPCTYHVFSSGNPPPSEQYVKRIFGSSNEGFTDKVILGAALSSTATDFSHTLRASFAQTIVRTCRGYVTENDAAGCQVGVSLMLRMVCSAPVEPALSRWKEK